MGNAQWGSLQAEQEGRDLTPLAAKFKRLIGVELTRKRA